MRTPARPADLGTGPRPRTKRLRVTSTTALPGALAVPAEARAIQLGLPGRARIHASYVCGDDPVMMLTGPIPATTAVLERGRVRLQDLDHVEINEAFASVPLAWLNEFPIEEDRLNPAGKRL